MVLDDMREKKCLSKGRTGIWEVGGGPVSRGVLETGNGLQKTEKEREKVVDEPGSKDCIAGNETNSCGEFRVRWRGLVGRWEVGHGRVSRGCCKQNTAFKRERKREKEAD